ncbi:MAG: ABC transporter ATP-binding protein [Actinobacteria bacterium]|uniref:ABC transporter ATP-binding protein n=1 Tax=Microcella pacifica TaxID=2591847 RepID=A0A9E5JM40_9MICO|nr:ABC transporter ATP-binding protein [Microcella pacifica]MBU1251095.1 ABC transporter ATP-binding protein [Actinomycetota bacterium]MBU1608835.1 ABC transporter ATP-binding protein [Actinomycetota bacterium]MBU2314574.1 ABC transporter ATP-binding protein [Actinomycetota bacterium]MBU2384231.1 ABC transporter ATP-binding protein [Actinomycetota bacterium]NHF63089.1 ABC transporter ATP-binding protein [Microcella pacifica]
MTAAVEITQLVKTYGRHRALDGLDLRVEEGSVHGFLGANGAGKTTALRILLGLARQTSGGVRVLGQEPGSASVSPRIGYCPDVPGFFSWMTAREVLESSARLFGLPTGTTRRRIDELLELTGLRGVDARVGGYSRGMRQRLGIAQALINSPALLVLDEPTSALDPLGRRVVLDLLAELRGRTTVLFSTHLLPDVERVCDTVAIIDHGRVLTAGSLAHVRTAFGGVQARIDVDVDDPARLRDALEGLPWIVTIDETAPGMLALTVTDLDEAQTRLPAEVAALGLRLRRVEQRDASLEDVFVGMVGVQR